MTTPQNLLPHLSTPVERAISGTASIEATGVEQSRFGDWNPFADDSDA